MSKIVTTAVAEALVAGIDEQRREIERAKSEAHAEKLETARQVMRDYVTVNGVEHDDPDCPEDDTCECPTIKNWNAVLR